MPGLFYEEAKRLLLHEHWLLLTISVFFFSKIRKRGMVLLMPSFSQLGRGRRFHPNKCCWPDLRKQNCHHVVYEGAFADLRRLQANKHLFGSQFCSRLWSKDILTVRNNASLSLWLDPEWHWSSVLNRPKDAAILAVCTHLWAHGGDQVTASTWQFHSTSHTALKQWKYSNTIQARLWISDKFVHFTV